jgi:carbon-monoxide dehydrogenase small subunit
VHGGTAQGIGQALMEAVVHGSGGEPLVSGFSDYAMPHATDVPSFETGHTEVRTTVNPLGTRGVGEGATIGATPAVANAVLDALGPLGVADIPMPMTPMHVWRAIKQAREAATATSDGQEAHRELARRPAPPVNEHRSRAGNAMRDVSMIVNGNGVRRQVEGRTLLVDFLREQLGLTGTHVGCDTTQCGACVVHVNGVVMKSCTMLALQCKGVEVTTIEGLAAPGAPLHPMQTAFREHHALQCGYCTSGMVMMALDIVRRLGQPGEETIREQLKGNICRCTGYHNIVKAIAANAKATAQDK